jgi:hypothetical protein
MLSHKDKENILREFPNVKLSYENITHKKVYNSDLIVGIPQGKKYFVWFTFYNEKPICLLLELNSESNNRDKKICNIESVNSCFSHSLCYGTIFYGTLFYHMNNKFFSIEDIFFNKDKDCSRENWFNKFKIISDILKKDIKQISYNNNFIIFGLPIISNSHTKFYENINNNNIKYKLSSIQYRNLNNCNNYLIIMYDIFLKDEIINLEKTLQLKETKQENIQNVKINKETKQENIQNVKINKETKQENIFIVKPDIQNDIYHLYLDNEYKGVACVPDYKTSVMLNNLFRNIKENVDLDTLEESDNEEEFENSNIDKFVYLERNYKMICNFNKKYKKWVPIKVYK